MIMDNTSLESDILRNFGGLPPNDLNSLLQTNEDLNPEIQTFDHSPYYDCATLDAALISNSHQFTVLSINIQSIAAKFDKLTAFLHNLQEKQFEFSAICLQETWLSENHDASIFQLPGYALISQEKKCCGHGGLIIYLNEQYTYNIRALHETSNIWEGLFIDIFGPQIDKKITLGNIYRPPKNNNNNQTIESFIQEFRLVIDLLDRQKQTTIITGDFNIDLLKINERQRFQEYFDLFVTSGFLPKLTLPTRFSRRNCTLIDQIFCKASHSSDKSSAGILISDLSDHLPYFLSIDVLSKKTSRPKFVKINTKDEQSIQHFCSYIPQVIQQDPLDPDLFGNPNSNYKKLEDAIAHSKNKCLPEKTVKFKKYKHRLSPWMTPEILGCLKFRDNLYKELKSTTQDSPAYDNIKINLHTYRAIVNRNIRQAKAIYYTKQLEKYRFDIKRTW